MKITWQQAVKSSLERYAHRNATIQIERDQFLQQELPHIILETGSKGKTPSQTLSRVLQELRDEGFLFFSKNGLYTLNQVPISAASEDFPDDVLENAVENGLLELSDVETSNDVAVGRVRRGMGALRKKTLSNYHNACALCDINDPRLLVTSHISRWADDPKARGLLSNTICFCTLHDKLFENGYFSMNDHFELIWKPIYNIKAINIWREQCSSSFKNPKYVKPALQFIVKHRARIGL